MFHAQLESSISPRLVTCGILLFQSNLIARRWGTEETRVEEPRF